MTDASSAATSLYLRTSVLGSGLKTQFFLAIDLHHAAIVDDDLDRTEADRPQRLAQDGDDLFGIIDGWIQ